MIIFARGLIKIVGILIGAVNRAGDTAEKWKDLFWQLMLIQTLGYELTRRKRWRNALQVENRRRKVFSSKERLRIETSESANGPAENYYSYMDHLTQIKDMQTIWGGSNEVAKNGDRNKWSEVVESRCFNEDMTAKTETQ